MMTLSPLIRTCFRSSRSVPLRTLLLIFGIALGVAGVIAIDIAKTSVSKSFNLSTAALTSRSTHQIMGNDFSIPQSLFTRVRTGAGIPKSAPVISRLVKVPQMDGRTLTFMGIDPFSEKNFRQTRFTESGRGEDLAFGTALAQGTGLVMDRDLALKHGLDQGSELTLLLGERQEKTRIAALADGKTSSGAFQGLLLADIALAQELLGMGDRITRIDLVLDSPEQMTLVKGLLAPGQVIVETDQRNRTIRGLSLSFETSLTAFSMLVLFMGIFLIYNTVSFSVSSRRRLNGTLRALGATRKEIFLAVEAEVITYALVGSVLGMGLGILLGKGAVQVVCATVSDMYYTLTVSQTHITSFTLFKGGVTGIGATLVSSIMPALNAAHTPPVTLMQKSAAESAMAGGIPNLTAAGCLIIGVALYIFHGSAAGMGLVFTGVFMVFAGSSLLAPALITGMARMMTRLTGLAEKRGMGPTWIIARMAVMNIRRSLSRTSVLIASLMVVISVYLGIDTMTRSFRLSLTDWVDGHIGGDIHLSSLDELSPALDKGLLEQIKAMDGVEAVSAYNIHKRFSSKSGEVHLFSYIQDLSLKEWTWLSPRANQGDKNSVNPLLDEGWILVSEIFARQNNLLPESGSAARVTMETLEGVKSFSVVGIFRDFFMGGGRVIVSRKAMARYWGKDDITAMQVFVRRDDRANKAVAIAGIIPKIREMADHPEMLRIRSGPRIKSRILSVFDKTFVITIALQALTALVALTGIVNSVTALILERSREIGILRACGAEPGQIRSLVVWECGVCGFMAGLLALPLGILLSWVLVDVVNFRSFGWTYEIRLSAVTMAQALGFSTLAALAAGIIPALKAGQIPVAQALRME